MKKHNLVLVPGLMCDHSAWDPMLEGLRSVACCQIIDHGQANSLVAMAQQLLALAPPRFALVGHSMGGVLARAAVSRLPDPNIATLVMTLASPHKRPPIPCHPSIHRFYLNLSKQPFLSTPIISLAVSYCIELPSPQ